LYSRLECDGWNSGHCLIDWHNDGDDFGSYFKNLWNPSCLSTRSGTQAFTCYQQSTRVEASGPNSPVIFKTYWKYCFNLLYILHYIWDLGCSGKDSEKNTGIHILISIIWFQLFKGIFFYCEGPDSGIVKNKTQCQELSANGNRWVNHKYNFDNLGQALMSLFVLSSKDGWVSIMYQGLDAVGPDQQVKRY